MSTLIKTQLKALPSKPGVYLFKDNHGKIIYVGKANNLSNRVKTYFSSNNNTSIKFNKLTASISDFEFIVTDSEQDALILENNLIKKYRPYYNVNLKDDKSFPYFKIDLQNDWPSLHYTRRFSKDGSRYFGPFADASSARKTFRLLKRIFRFRSCNKTITGTSSKPCLNYHINRCLGPCIGAISKSDYDEVIKQVILFLEGKQELICRDLKDKMEKASLQMDFEKAALFRDQIKAIKSVIEGQKIAVVVSGDHDVIAIAQTTDIANIEVFFIRNNKLMGRDSNLVYGIQDESPEQIMTSFIKQYYAEALVPPKILLQHPINEVDVITRWLKSRRGASVSLFVPHRGTKKQLIDIVTRNAHHGLELYQARQLTLGDPGAVLIELKERLQLPAIPQRIEGYDISNIQGTSAAGSMVVYNKGIPKPSFYRKFKIKTVTGIDDYSMMQEVLRRRFNKFISTETNWATNVPDLVLIDGGKGHLNAAVDILKELGLDSIPITSIAKEKEDVFIPGKSEPVFFPETSAALYLLQRIRDESHRFAISYHRNLRSKKSIDSALNNVTGIGPKRKKALLNKFGSVQAIKNASEEDLTTITGINSKLANHLKKSL